MAHYSTPSEFYLERNSRKSPAQGHCGRAWAPTITNGRKVAALNRILLAGYTLSIGLKYSTGAAHVFVSPVKISKPPKPLMNYDL